ncbi:Rne/Rng family ribonuclease [Falsigemmobacter faecalis]|uniref:Ribonuclease E n=1 Tax=Falsigemmobacter faecalis TaxID=2488730 RepID=A0A3P3DLP6_9RHOB|nr:ribonuclease E/G [Falsigemmobacter faecalis]RRH75113.1 ribonuclease E/G [Falsigemmobacter faecalis]
MAKKMLIDATHPEETRVVVVDGNKVEEFDFETVNKRQLAGNIYLAKVTRVEPSLQAAFVDYGGNRHGFLAFAEIHPDYYQIPQADRKALIDEERAMQRAEADEENGSGNGNGGRSRNRSRHRSRPAQAEGARADAVTSTEVAGMDVVDLGEETGAEALVADFAGAAVAHDHDHGHDHGALDHPGDFDDEIESVGEEDLAEEIPEPRRARPKKYKIQEVVKVRQIMLVQVVKEERGNKGAALTTYLSLAGRYCVLMPNTARGGGISRKITNAPDRKKLKEIAGEIEVPEGAGLIIRTAGAKRTKQEIRRDYEYLCRLWEQIRELTFKSNAPAPIYEEGDLIKRTIRDLYTREIDEVLVEGAEGYRAAKDFMRMIMPTQASVVKPYVDAQPLFARFQVESYLAGMFNPVVQLKSGGYIVIGITEALVAVDVNSGRATKEGSIEDTAVKTNLEAADEIARQLRLRDLAGLIVIDFIDMEERKNNAAVEKRLKDKLKTDRARIQVGRISGFGLMEMSRQRLRPGMLESTTQPCAHCHGTGLIRSDDNQALAILRALEEEGTRRRSREVLLKAPIAVINYLFNHKREHIAQIEARYGMAVRMEADPALVSPDYVIEKFKTATRLVAAASSQVVSLAAGVMPDLEEEPVFEEELIVEDEVVAEVEVVEAEAAETPAEPEAAGADGNGKKKRRRRRRRRGGKDGAADGVNAEGADDEDDGSDEDEAEETVAAQAVDTPVVAEPVVAQPVVVAEPAVIVAEPVAAEAEAAPVAEAPAKPKRSRAKKPAAAVAPVAEVVEVVAEVVAEEPPAKPRRSRATKAKVEAVEAEAVTAEAPAKPKRAPAKPKGEKAPAKPRATRTPKAKAAAAAEAPEAAAPVAAETPAPAPAPAAEPAATGRRKGWWAV